MDLLPLLAIKLVRRRLPKWLRHMDERLGAALEEVIAAGGGATEPGRISPRKAFSFLRPAMAIMRRDLLASNPARARAVATRHVQQSAKNGTDRVMRASGPARVDAILADLHALPKDLVQVVPHWLTSLLAANIVSRLSLAWLKEPAPFDKLGRSLPGNVTSEMGLLVGDLADIARGDPSLIEFLQTRSNENFYDGLEAIPGGAVFKTALHEFMDRFGMRCPAEIDLGTPRWRETPTALIPAIMGHIRSVDEGQHRIKFAEGEREAKAAMHDMVARVRVRKGRLRAKILCDFLTVYRELAGLREHHKYLVVQHLDVYRCGILADAQTLVTGNVLQAPADVFYLALQELRGLQKGKDMQVKGRLIPERQCEMGVKPGPDATTADDGRG